MCVRYGGIRSREKKGWCREGIEGEGVSIGFIIARLPCYQSLHARTGINMKACDCFQRDSSCLQEIQHGAHSPRWRPGPPQQATSSQKINTRLIGSKMKRSFNKNSFQRRSKHYSESEIFRHIVRRLLLAVTVYLSHKQLLSVADLRPH